MKFSLLGTGLLLNFFYLSGCGDIATPAGEAAIQRSLDKGATFVPPATPASSAAQNPPKGAQKAQRAQEPLELGASMATRMRPDAQMILSDRARFADLAEVPVGTIVAIADDFRLDAESWRAMGFLPDDAVSDGPGESRASVSTPLYRREVDLLGTVSMVLSQTPELPEVDCIALISIDRRNGETPYVYTTLKSIFSRFPPQVKVNVLVGNEDTEYVSPRALIAEIGAEWAARVHVIPTSAEISDYLRGHLPPNRRGGWNYTRALRSYAGKKGLVLMEDDVVWAQGGLGAFNSWIAAHPVPAFSFYTIYFDRIDALKTQDAATLLSDGKLFFVEQSTHRRDFTCLQGMYYSAKITADLGRYTLMRQHHLVYDAVIGWFFTENEVTMGYPFPSMVQHIGTQSSCDSGTTHASHFFREVLSTDL